MATTHSDDERAFSESLRSFCVAHKQRGRGANQWLADVFGKAKGQASSWLNGKVIPGEQAWRDVELALARNKELEPDWVSRLSAVRETSFFARKDREEREAAARVIAQPAVAGAVVTPHVPPADLAAVWSRLDDSRRKSVVQLAEIIAGAAPGEWIAGQIASFEAVARLHPLPSRANGSDSA